MPGCLDAIESVPTGTAGLAGPFPEPITEQMLRDASQRHLCICRGALRLMKPAHHTPTPVWHKGLLFPGVA
jgi:hypothetical protein